MNVKGNAVDVTHDGAVFRVVDLTKVYTMGEVHVHALRGVTLDVDEGQLLVLLGHSGSGKSTLLNIIGGLDVPTAGQVYYRGREMTAADERALTEFRRRNVGFVFQFYNLIPSLTALENVAVVTDIAAEPMRPEEALALVGLEDRLHHFPAQLSGGEQQRVAVARALAKAPKLILGDEPTGNLDFRTGKLVLAAMRDINREGKTVMIVTHNAPLARVADRILHIRDGAIVEQEIVAEPIAPEDVVW